jgi:hypothetical protein
MGFKPMRKEKDREAAREVLLLYGALPIAYVVLGRLGLSFATSPGYATAVFLPAGIAIAATLVTGVTALPGIFIGSFVLNLWVSYANTQELTNTTIAAAVAIASASGVASGQAAAAPPINLIKSRRLIASPAPARLQRGIASNGMGFKGQFARQKRRIACLRMGHSRRRGRASVISRRLSAL